MTSSRYKESLLYNAKPCLHPGATMQHPVCTLVLQCKAVKTESKARKYFAVRCYNVSVCE